MAKMKAVDAAVLVLEREGVSVAFGVPGAAINPLYAALRRRGSIRHILARHVEGGFPHGRRLHACEPATSELHLGTSGPAGTDMITGLYAAAADRSPFSASPDRHRERSSIRRISRPSTSRRSRSPWRNGR